MTVSLLLGLLACSDNFKDEGDNVDPGPDTLDVDDDGDGYTDNDGDCDDTDAAVNPDAAEVAYNGADDDCDAETPDNDGDGDGVAVTEDCDDGNANVSPEADEVPYNGIDDDCNARTSDNDADGDGFERNTDCDDANPEANPEGEEVDWNNVDEDCDGYDVNLQACVTRGVTAAMRAADGAYSVDDYSDDYSLFGYGIQRSVVDQMANLATGTPRVNPGSGATTFALDLGATLALNDETMPFTMTLEYDVLVDSGFFQCTGWTSPVATDFEGNVVVRVSGTRVTATTSVTADRTPFTQDVLTLEPYPGSPACSLDLIDTGLGYAEDYFGISLPRSLSVFDASAAAAVTVITSDLEEAVDAQVASACSKP
jgi:hypothetical protein